MEDFKHYGNVEKRKDYFYPLLDNLRYRLEHNSQTEINLQETMKSIQHRLDCLNEQANYYRRSMNHYTDFIMFYENSVGLAYEELSTFKSFFNAFLKEQEFEHINVNVSNNSYVKDIFKEENLDNAKNWLKGSENVLKKLTGDIAATEGLMKEANERLKMFSAS